MIKDCVNKDVVTKDFVNKNLSSVPEAPSLGEPALLSADGSRALMRQLAAVLPSAGVVELMRGFRVFVSTEGGEEVVRAVVPAQMNRFGVEYCIYLEPVDLDMSYKNGEAT